ncbi:MAG: FAD-dependent oxidoreductase [Promethearchaeota archaeon]
MVLGRAGLNTMEKPDVIVVGAGPAGSAAAFTLAKKGLNVLLVERGKTPGEKNVSGAVLFGQVLNRLIPNFWDDAPIERFVKTHRLNILSKGSWVSIDFTSKHFTKPPFNGITVIRSKFDKWFAKKAEEAGALLATGIRVDELLWKDNRVAGIRAGNDEVWADVVIAADGVNSLLAKEAKLRKHHRPEFWGLGVKEVISLPRDVIDERFCLSDREGAAFSFLGCSKGYPGGGFVYTNLDTLAIGVVVHLTAFKDAKIRASDLVEDFKSFPVVERLIRGGKVLEYSAHLVPEGGYTGLSKLYTDGLLVTGDAAGFALNIGYSVEGINFAIASGVAAAKTAVLAKERGNFSKKTMKNYLKFLHQDFVLQDLITFKRAPAFLRNPNVYNIYPEVITSIAEELFASRGTSRRRLLKVVLSNWRKQSSLITLIRDGIQAVRAL